MTLANLPFDLLSLRAAYAAGHVTPLAVLDEARRRIRAQADEAVWLHLVPEADLQRHVAQVMARGPAEQPLYGVPFAIKDNIHLAGAPTTAACPAFASSPERSATVVERLMAAGAVPIGKTNLDQFATGLVGTRSPYGVPRNPFDPALIPGGSSSGSAVAVATGTVAFALGTDTAGSGRVPAALNHLVGLKPTRGWLSTRGVVPACRTLDCVSVFALSVEDAFAVADVAAGFDAEDPYSRRASPVPAPQPAGPFRFGVPRREDLEWFGDPLAPVAFNRALEALEALGGEPVTIDLRPFLAAARLLYEGPWLAERWSAVRRFHAHSPHALLPVTRQIIEAGAELRAVEGFEAQYRLAALQREVEGVWDGIDALVLPTLARPYRRDEVAREPIALNSRLGHYTNFANLLDTAALAVPAGFRSDGIPFGVTLFGPAWSDRKLGLLGGRLHRQLNTTCGATPHPIPPPPAVTGSDVVESGYELAVVGAHLRDQPLNPELTRRGGRFVRAATTSSDYRLYLLPGATPPKPGLVRVARGSGAAIEVEIWALAPSAWADFVAAIPSPLALGKLRLSDGRLVSGFLCEPVALAGATDLTAHGGWRSYLQGITA